MIFHFGLHPAEHTNMLRLFKYIIEYACWIHHCSQFLKLGQLPLGTEVAFSELVMADDQTLNDCDTTSCDTT